MKKVRVVRYAVQPELVVDDGTVLTPLLVQPIMVDADKWDAFVAFGLKTALDQLEREQNAAPTPLVPLHAAVNGKAERKAMA